MASQGKLVVLVFLLFFSTILFAGGASQRIAFDGAKGYGRYTLGGYGGKVYVVTSLEDNQKAKPGTLRHAIKAKGPRVIVFDVSGIINLYKPLEIKNDFITIAGQTSPKGIVITGAETQIKASQVIIRYMRFRTGIKGAQDDALNAKNQSDIIIDHCSLSWASDEVGSFYNNRNFTLQHSIISESLNSANHVKGEHGYGGIWGGNNASFLSNVLAHHSSRNPRINGYRLGAKYPQSEEFVEIYNNVIYNWKDNSTYGNENGRANIVNNYYKLGPAEGPVRFFQLDKENNGVAFVQGNFMYQHPNLTNENRRGVEVKNHKKLSTNIIDARIANFLSKVPISPSSQVKSDVVGKLAVSALNSFNQLVAQQEVGANRNRHGKFSDSVDVRILNDVKSGTAKEGNGIINSELQSIVSWQEYANEFDVEEYKPIPLDIINDADVLNDWLDELGRFTPK
ncbi:pectate lyase family protein [Glaciecola sp. 1036]|uniref:pectate lyase family protein n=1 Tax=Alteromonadaceae TaxID=72275 RepID=UPI003CFD17EF